MPCIDGKTLIGWGAVRDFPWHFAGLFQTQAEAQTKADEMGFGYIARYGERQEETDSFLSEKGTSADLMHGSIFAPASTDRGSSLAAVAGAIDKRIEYLRR